MQKYFLLSLLFLSFNSFAQNCVNAVSNDEVQIQYKKLSAQPTDQLKLNYLNSWMRGRCVMSDQAYLLASMFNDDNARLQFAISAYPIIYDKQNYYAVFDAFNSLSYAFRFYDFVNSNIIEYNEPPPPAPVEIFPDLNYPSSVGYKGLIACDLPMSDNDFNVLVKPIVDAIGDVNRGTTASTFMQANCISMAQFMMLSTLIQLDMNRMKFLKQNFTHCYDLQNYSFAAQLFTTQNYKDDWNLFADATIKSLLPPPPPPVPVCFVSDNDMNEIIASISKQSFASTRLSSAKQILSAKKCFTINQIKQIIALLDFDSDKLDVAKYAFDYCTEQKNYYLMTDVFGFESSGSELLEYIKGK